MKVTRIDVAVERVVRPSVRGTEAGFALMEVMVAALVLLAGIFAMVQFISSTEFRLRDSEDRLVLNQVANREIESIRALPYDQVATQGGNPSGNILDDETTTVEGVSIRIQREVMYIEDPAYAALSSHPFPANYRRVTVRVTAVGNGRIKPVEVSTNVAGGAQGGSLDITVTNVSGTDFIEDALLVITNTHLSPAVNIDSDAIRTDLNGKMLVPGLTPDSTPAYYVRANKTGYNSAQISPGVIVNEGFPYTPASLKIDLLGTINIHLTDNASPTPHVLTGVQLIVSGPIYVPTWIFTQTVTTDGQGNATIANLPYSLQQLALWQGGNAFHTIKLVSPGTRPALKRVFSVGDFQPFTQAPNIPPVGRIPAGTIPVVLDPGSTQQVNLVWPL